MEVGNSVLSTHEEYRCKRDLTELPLCAHGVRWRSVADGVWIMKRLFCLAGLLLSLTACASGPNLPPIPTLPYPAWYVGLAAPQHMEVWVETVDVLDQRGLAFFRVHGGVSARLVYCRAPEKVRMDFTGAPRRHRRSE